jgi:peroxiredoxin
MARMLALGSSVGYFLFTSRILFNPCYQCSIHSRRLTSSLVFLLRQPHILVKMILSSFSLQKNTIMFYLKYMPLVVLGFLFIKGPISHQAEKQVGHSPRDIVHSAEEIILSVNKLGTQAMEDRKSEKDSSKVLIGKKAPNFKLNSLDGEEVALNDFKGKVVILDFWASWCKPCLKELPRVQKIYQDFKKDGLVVLGMNAEKIPKAQSFVKKHDLTFTNLHDSDRKVAHTKYYVNAIPSVFIIDRKGIVRSYLVGLYPENELREAVEKVGL